MFDFGLILYLISILGLAIVHTIGEVIYKKGTMPLTKKKQNSESLGFQKLIFPMIVIGFSFGISLIIKIIYGIFLGSNPFSSTTALFLGAIAIFSIILGKIFFQEQISSYQLVGIILIATGIVLVI